jgi:hypothetical protein
MEDIRDRIQQHRTDVLLILAEVTKTATLYVSNELAGAVSHLARAHALLTEELESPSESAETD